MLGRLRPRQGLALYQVQSVLLLLQGMPDAELETPQARLYDGSFASSVRAGGNGGRTRPDDTPEGPTKERHLLYLP